MFRRLIVPTAMAIYGFVRGVLDLIGYVDLVITHQEAKTDTWLGKLMSFLLHILVVPPAWTAVPLVIVGLGWIWWDIRRHQLNTPPLVFGGRGWPRLGGIFVTAPLVYDISVLDFLKLGPKYGWDFAKSEGWLYLDIQDALVDGAANGLIKVWGRKVPSANFPSSILNTVPLVEIPRDYWAAGGVLMRVPMNMKGELIEDSRAALAQRNFNDKERYEDLHLARRQALRWARGHASRFKGRHLADNKKRNP